MNDVALLAACDLRVDVGGAIAIEGTTFESRGVSVALLGDEHGILSAIAGTAEVRSGSLHVLGADVSRREHLRTGRVGVAPLDPPLPPRWSAREYLVWGSRLAGSTRAAAERDAARCLADLGLETAAGAELESLSPAERRAMVIAQAVITDPAVLVASSPLSGLSGPEAAYVARTLSAASRGRQWIVSLSKLYAGSPESLLARAADDLLLFASGKLVRQGKLERIEDGTVGYTILLRGKATEFRDALRARGVELSGGPQRFFVELPPGMKAENLLALSLDLGAPIIELVPRIMLTP